MDRTLATDIVAFAEALYTVDRAWVPDGHGGWKGERKRPIVLQDWQRAQLYDVFPPDNGGRPAVRNYLDSTPKKTGKSCKAGIVAAYLAATEPNAEVYICAADQDQARDRVFKSLVYAVDHGPLGEFAKVLRDEIRFSNGSVVQAFAQDFKGAAGGEPLAVIFDELHTYTYESNRRLWDEMVIPPTLPYGVRWVASYAGWVDESLLLAEVWDKVLAGAPVQDLPGGHIYHNDAAGWWGTILQDEDAYELVPWGQGERGRQFLEEARETEREASYTRLFKNRWAQNENSFVPLGWWQSCCDPLLKPLQPTQDVELVVGVDCAVKPGGDDAAVIACYLERDTKRVVVAWHRVWKGGKERKRELRMDQSIEPYLLAQAERYRLRAVHYDPRFFTNSANRLRGRGLRMVEVVQSRPELGPLGQGLYNMVQDRRLAYYDDPDLKYLASGAKAQEIPSGLHIVKGEGKVDLLVALSFAVGALSKPRGVFFA